MTTTIGISLEWFRSAIGYHCSTVSSSVGDVSSGRGEFELCCPSVSQGRENRFSLLVVHRKGAKEVRARKDGDTAKNGEQVETAKEELLRQIVSYSVTRGRYALTEAAGVTSSSTERNVASPDNGWTGIGIVMDGDTVHHSLLEMCSFFISRKKPSQSASSAASGSGKGNRIRSVSSAHGTRKDASAEAEMEARLRSACIDLALALIDMLASLPLAVRHSKSVLVVSLPTLPTLLSPGNFVSACALAVDTALAFLHNDASFGVERFFIVPQVMATLNCMLAPIPMTIVAEPQRHASGEVGLLVFPHGNRTTSPLDLSMAKHRVVIFRGSTKSLCAYVMLLNWESRVGRAEPELSSVSLEFQVADAAGCGGDAIDNAILHQVVYLEGEKSAIANLPASENIQLVISIKAARHRMLAAMKRSQDKGQSHNFAYVSESRVKKFPLTQDVIDRTALEMNEQRVDAILAKVAKKLQDTQVDAFVTSGECFAIPALCRAVEQSVAVHFSPQLARGSVVVHSVSSAQFCSSEVAAASGCCLFGYQALDGKKKASIVRRSIRLSAAAYFFQRLPRTTQVASPSVPLKTEFLTQYDLLLKSNAETDSWVVMIPRGTTLPAVRVRCIMLMEGPARLGASIQLLAVEHGQQRVLTARIPAFRFECDRSADTEASPGGGGRTAKTGEASRVAHLTVSLSQHGEVRIDVLHMDTGAFATSGWTHAIRELAVVGE